MTNGTVDTIGATKVDKADAHVFSVSYDGGEKKVVVAPNTIVVEYVPATTAAITPGSHVIVLATKTPDGAYASGVVSVGKDGLVPPM